MFRALMLLSSELKLAGATRRGIVFLFLVPLCWLIDSTLRLFFSGEVVLWEGFESKAGSLTRLMQNFA